MRALNLLYTSVWPAAAVWGERRDRKLKKGDRAAEEGERTIQKRCTKRRTKGRTIAEARGTVKKGRELTELPHPEAAVTQGTREKLCEVNSREFQYDLHSQETTKMSVLDPIVSLIT